ncbi:Aminopeptidase C [Alteracholeplasma palmae J233]|uniref:Aminopeptidase n=1 Tax=Alteracholeplasma palmae (strain ATCC 49389 / J233) TaxID=1318466 RepID=U4KKM2_ALTPJ|nr:C1 family peptidase [Alteracholeplasma palmae]CCV64192.1 Aminopeptidase C [Alteracholeplasma palmae J233]
MRKIEEKNIKVLTEKYQEKKVQNALKTVLNRAELQTILYNQEKEKQNQFKFSVEIPTLPVANQKMSGRCWIFAGLNVLREYTAKKLNVSEFEFSQNYIAFWDKFEKINYFIEIMDDFLTTDIDDRTLQHLLHMGIQDGGQWAMFVSVVEKYGVMPKEVMPETSSSSNTRIMNQVINRKLRQYAALSRKASKSELVTLKEKTLEELYTFLVTCFGMPPKIFNYEYVDKDNQYHLIENLDPKKFYNEYTEHNLTDYISIINAPTKDKPFMKTYTVPYLGNVIGGQEIKYINLNINDFKNLVIKQLENKDLVWFGSDVAYDGDRQVGFWDDQTFDYENLFEIDVDLEKDVSLDFGHSIPGHAMVITGVNLLNGKPNRFKIENSWGNQNGNKGYYVCSDSWFNKYVYQAVIKKELLTQEQKLAWEEKPIVLKPWDPMGTLAK